MTGLFSRQCGLAMLALFIAACAGAGPGVAETNSDNCNGQTIKGPWFQFLLPDGMTVEGAVNGEVKTSSVWLKAEVANAPIAFFLFSPLHGGKAYPIFQGSTNVHKLVQFDTENGETLKYIITYTDGTVGLFEGNSQKVTGLRVGDTPLGQAELANYSCFLDSIEQFAE